VVRKQQNKNRCMPIDLIMNKKQLLKAVIVIALGFILWLIIGPFIISHGVNVKSYLTFIGWIGLSISITGVVAVIKGLSLLI